MSPVPAKFQRPSCWMTRPPPMSFTFEPVRFIVPPVASRVVPVPLLVPPVQLEAGVGPLIVNSPLPARFPLDSFRVVVVAVELKHAVPPSTVVRDGLYVPPVV